MADNKKYYYLKLKEGFFESDEMLILQRMPDGYLYSDILMKLYLRSLKDDGKLMYKNRIPYSPDVLATVCRHQVGTVEKALETFEKLGLIEVLDNGAIYMLDIQNYIGQSSTEADRQREYYRKIQNEKKLVVEQQESGEVPAELPQIPAQSEPQPEPQPQKKTSNYPTDFEKFWSAYPRKADKGQAYKKYCTRVKDGFSPDELYQAAVNYAASCRDNRTEEKFIKHGKTFLGDSTPFIDFLPKNGAQGITESSENDNSNPFRKG